LALVAGLLMALPLHAHGQGQAPIWPDPTRTPGATNSAVSQHTIHKTICMPGWTSTVRPAEAYTYALKVNQLRDWGYADQNPHDYEEDHFIPVELGGSPTSPQNLWPEPIYGEWNAHEKDGLEARLRDLVCAGRLSLADAQRAITTNWVAAYRKYVDGG
jgi:hypothetical protein